MITIVEGHDCAGKSTLIQNAYSNAGWKHHFGKPSHKGAWADYLGAVAEYTRIIDGWHDDDPDEVLADTKTNNPVRHIVIDRFIYGELVYPTVMNRSSTFTRAQARMLERVLLSHQAALIFCHTDYTLAKELWKERQGSEMIQEEERFKQAYNLWETLFDKPLFPGLPSVQYDLKLHKYDHIRNMLPRPPRNEGPGIGMYKRDVTVLVGEQVNANVDTFGWPFVAPSGSSLWLTKLLDDLGYSEADLYWINALDKNGKETDPSFIRQMRPKRVIALGKTAELWAKRNEVDAMNTKVVAVPHPQYHKRFQSKEPYLLEEALKDG